MFHSLWQSQVSAFFIQFSGAGQRGGGAGICSFLPFSTSYYYMLYVYYIVVAVAYVPGYVPISIQRSQNWSIASFVNRPLIHLVTMVMTLWIYTFCT